MFRLIVAFLLSLLVFLLSRQPVFAHLELLEKSMIEQNLVFADNFDQGLERWQSTRGSLLDWSTVDGWAKAEIDLWYYPTELIPKPEFWQPSWQNYVFAFDFMPETNGDLNWAWGYQNQDNWYEIHFFNGDWHLVRLENGQQVFNRFGDFRLKAEQVYQVKILFNQGQISFWIDDVLIFEGQDHSYAGQSGPIALKATTGMAGPTRVRYDNIRVWLVNDESSSLVLGLDRFFQHDPRWAEQEYNGASFWSTQPTIERWGCALSSLAMILRYFDYVSLPDGSQLDPGSLNQWLRHQPDGYVGQGALNWLAGSRLSKILSDELSIIGRQFPKLEFYRTSMPSVSDIISKIKDNRPIILQIPGHFLVAHGFNQVKDDIVIADPAYQYTQLSQHRQSVFSMIDYQPSQTDLSSIMLVYPADITVELIQPQLETQLFTDTLASFDQINDGLEGLLLLHPQNQELNSNPVTRLIQKPATGNYQFIVGEAGSSAADKIYPIEFYIYDAVGGLHQTTRLVKSGQQLELSFDKQLAGASNLNSSSQLDFEQFLVKLSEWDSELIKKRYVWFQLKQVVELAAQVSDVEKRARFEQWFWQIIKNYRPLIADQLF
ncbi:MAG: hypothetical protein GF381_01010 [Candidatus Pacebacteria bacterium]|nr:hypothetical protein [Candidatus Paceibacterota bacterium]